MKHIISFIAVIAAFVPAHAYKVCSTAITSTEIAHTTVTTNAAGLTIGLWAVGSGCNTGGTEIDTMCTSVIVGGTAFCGPDYWVDTNDLDESTAEKDCGCWCRRTKVLENGVLIDSIGQGVLLGAFNDNATNCQNTCAQRCAESVATNTNGMRHAIMTLPDY